MSRMESGRGQHSQISIQFQWQNISNLLCCSWLQKQLWHHKYILWHHRNDQFNWVGINILRDNCLFKEFINFWKSQCRHSPNCGIKLKLVGLLLSDEYIAFSMVGNKIHRTLALAFVPPPWCYYQTSRQICLDMPIWIKLPFWHQY